MRAMRLLIKKKKFNKGLLLKKKKPCYRPRIVYYITIHFLMS